MAKLRVAELFTSVQGEGIWVGVPSTFIRLSGCNLRCRWCDTPYASWRPEGPMVEVDELVEQAGRRGVRHVVLTGGEPMLCDAVEELAAGLSAEQHLVTVETSGTIFRALPCDLMSISPKLSNSTPPEDTPGDWARRHELVRGNLEPMARLIESYPCQLKFVVNPEGDADDLGEVEALLEELPPVPKDRVLLMAEGRDPETLHRRERSLVEVCVRHGWRLTPRFHIDLFGDKRAT